MIDQELTFTQWVDMQLGDDKDWSIFLKMITTAALLNPELMTKGILVGALKEIQQGCKDIMSLSNVDGWLWAFNKHKLNFVSVLIILLETNQVPA